MSSDTLGRIARGQYVRWHSPDYDEAASTEGASTENSPSELYQEYWKNNENHYERETNIMIAIAICLLGMGILWLTIFYML